MGRPPGAWAVGRLSLRVMVFGTGAERVRPRHHRGTTMEYYAGIDVSLKDSSVCVVDAAGRIAWWLGRGSLSLLRARLLGAEDLRPVHGK